MCGCIETITADLKSKNGELLTTLFGTPRIIISPGKVGRGKKPPYLLASYCPFCGEQYPQAEDQNPVARAIIAAGAAA